MTMRRHGAVVAAAAALAGLVAGCSSSTAAPTAGDFAPGSCRQAAPAVLQIGHMVNVAHKQHGVRPSTLQALSGAQSTLRHQPAKPAGSDTLITAIGFLRIRVDSHTYQPQLLTDVSTAQRALQRACTASANH